MRKTFLATLLLAITFACVSPATPLHAATSAPEKLFADSGKYDSVEPYINDHGYGYFLTTINHPNGFTKFYGLLNAQGVEVLPCEYIVLEVSMFVGSELILAHTKDGRTAVFNRATGKVIIEPGQYHELHIGADNTVIVTQYNKVEYIDRGDGFADSLFYGQEGFRTGVIDQFGEIIVPVEYFNVRFESGVGYHAFTTDYSLDPNYREDIFSVHKTTVFDTLVSATLEPFGVVTKDGKYGIIDNEYNYLVQPIYDYLPAGGYYNAINAQLGDKWGVIDSEGNVKSNFTYAEIGEFADATSLRTDLQGFKNDTILAAIAKKEPDGKYGFIDENGTPLTDFIFDEAGLDWYYHTHDGLRYDQDGSAGVPINLNGMTPVLLDGKEYYLSIFEPDKLYPLRKPEYRYQHTESEGLIAFRADDFKIGYLDAATMEVVLPAIYQSSTVGYTDGEHCEAASFRSGIASVMLNDKYVLINPKGEVIIEFPEDVYVPLSTFSSNDGMVVVNKKIPIGAEGYPTGGTQIALYNYKGEALIPFDNNLSDDFTDPGSIFPGLTPIPGATDGSAIDKDGNTVKVAVNEDGYSLISKLKPGFIKVKQNGLWGLVNEAGQVVIPIKYEAQPGFLQGNYERMDYLIVKKDGKYGVVDFNDKIIIPFEYDSLERQDSNGTSITLLGTQRNAFVEVSFDIDL